MTPTPEAIADMARHKQIEDAALVVAHEWRPTHTLDQQILEARERMGESRWNELNAEWKQ